MVYALQEGKGANRKLFCGTFTGARKKLHTVKLGDQKYPSDQKISIRGQINDNKKAEYNPQW